MQNTLKNLQKCIKNALQKALQKWMKSKLHRCEPSLKWRVLNSKASVQTWQCLHKLAAFTLTIVIKLYPYSPNGFSYTVVAQLSTDGTTFDWLQNVSRGKKPKGLSVYPNMLHRWQLLILYYYVNLFRIKICVHVIKWHLESISQQTNLRITLMIEKRMAHQLIVDTYLKKILWRGRVLQTWKRYLCDTVWLYNSS